MTLISETEPRLQTGFTLLEVLLVLVILGFTSALLVPNLSGLDSRTFNAQVREASSLLNYSRRTAVVQGYPVTATFSTSAEDGASPGAESQRGRPDGWTSRGIEVGYRDSTDQRVEVLDEIAVSFYPEGGSSGGELILRQGNRAAVLSIDPFSGRVSTRFDED